jgi:putative acetyltransferase
VVREAFGRNLEGTVIDGLRASNDYLPDLSLVALQDGEIVGHIMVTAQDIVSGDGERVASSILAPLAVAPARQLQGIGQALMCAALDRAREAGLGSMILIGHPTYYPRFGFLPASTWGIRLAAPVPDEVFMAIELIPGALAKATGSVTLSPAFDESEE